MIKRLASLVVLLVLSACAHHAPEPGRAAADVDRDVAGAQELRFLFTANRHGALEPCGCSLAPFGGVQREWNALTFVKGLAPSPVVPFSIGTTFVPLKADYKSGRLELYRRKAAYVADALKGLGTRAVGISVDDLILGRKDLARLEDRSGAAFVSANLVDGQGKPLFRRAITMTANGARIVVTSVSHGVREPYGAPEGVAVLDATAALAQTIAETGKPDLLVVLSSLPPSGRDAAIAALDVPTIWAGGIEIPDELDVAQPRAGVAYLSPLEQGRSVMAATVRPAPGMKALGSKEVADRQAAWKKQLREEIASLRKEARGKKIGKAKRDGILASAKKVEATLARVGAYVDTVPSGAATYDVRAHVLDDRFQDPEGPLATIVRKAKEDVREVMSLEGQE